MPSKKLLVQEDHLFTENVGNPAVGYLGFYSKSDNNFYKRTSAALESKLWDSGNHGSGSGLDADLLDGQHASSFAPVSHSHSNYVLKTGDTMSNHLYIQRVDSLPTTFKVEHNADANTGISSWIQSLSASNGTASTQFIASTKISGIPTSHNVAEVTLNSGVVSISYGSNSYNRVRFRTGSASIGDVVSVLCEVSDAVTAWVPISSFGGGGGGGTVTSVGLSAPSVLFGITGSPVTTSGVISLNLNGQVQNTVFAAPVSNNGYPTFRTLVAADIPALNYMPNVICQEGRLLGRAAGTGAGTPYDVRLGAGLGWDVDGNLEVTAGGGGSGTVTSVGLSMPNIFSVTGSPVTTTGTLTASLVSQSQRLFLASPVSGSGVPTFRAIHGNDLPDLSGVYDLYGSWNMQVNDAATKMILKSGSTQYSTMYNGIKLIAGSNITLTESVVGSALGITIAAAGGGGLSYASIALNQSPAPISANTWTDIPAAQYATWGSGSYLIMGTIQVTKSTTGAGLVAARIILSNGTVIASAEHYHYTTTTNRMSFTLSGIYQMGGGAALTAKLQIWSNQTGWSAVANTPTTNSIGATKIEVIKIS